VIRLTDPTVKQHLGELRAEQFYGDQRLIKARNLRNELSAAFRENDVQLADILIRQYDYPDTFQSLTEQKKIQDQSVLTNRALAKQAEVETRLKLTVAQGQNLINLKTAEYQAQITGINQRELLSARGANGLSCATPRPKDRDDQPVDGRTGLGEVAEARRMALLNGIRVRFTSARIRRLLV
jgi:hypothetical protein